MISHVSMLGSRVNTYVDQICLIPHMQVVYYRRFVQVGELGHVSYFVEFGRIDFVNAVTINFPLLFSH